MPSIVKARYIRSIELIDYKNHRDLIASFDFASWPDYVQAEWMKKVARNLDEGDKKVIKGWFKHTKPLAADVFLKSLDVIPREFKEDMEAWLDMDSYEVKANVLLKLSMSFRGDAPRYLEQLEGVVGTRGEKVQIYRYMVELYLEDNRHVQDWIDRTGPSYDFMTRMNALDGMATFGYFLNDRVTVNLFQALFQGNRRLRSKARDYLGECYKNEDYQKTILAFVNDMSPTWETWQKSRVSRALGIELE